MVKNKSMKVTPSKAPSTSSKPSTPLLHDDHTNSSSKKSKKSEKKTRGGEGNTIKETKKQEETTPLIIGKSANANANVNDNANVSDAEKGLNFVDVSKCVSTLLEAHKAWKMKKKTSKANPDLFETSGDGEKINLVISAIKLPKDSRSQLLSIGLPHEIRLGKEEEEVKKDVLLIVKDLKKGLQIDHEDTVHHFKDLLSSAGVDKVTEVISLRQLKVEYKTYETKTSLVHRYDTFLADETILRLLPQFLGKPFYKRKRFPIPVNLGNPKNLKKNIDKALKTAILPLNHHGTCSMITVGTTNMKMSHIVENITSVASKLRKRYPGGWKNVRSIHVKTEKSLSIPVHVSSLSTNAVGFVDSDIPDKIKRKTETDELSTLPGAKVTVTASGNVKIERIKDPNWNDDAEEPFISGSEDENDDNDQLKESKKAKKQESKKKMNKKEKKTEKVDVDRQKVNPKKRSREDSDDEDEQDKNTKNKKKSAKTTKEDNETDSEDEEALAKAELEYMKKVAEEEEAIEAHDKVTSKSPLNKKEDSKKLKSNPKKRSRDDSSDEEDEAPSKKKANEEESEEEDEDEDSEDAENKTRLEFMQKLADREDGSSDDDDEEYDDDQDLDETNVIADIDEDDDEEDEESDDQALMLTAQPHGNDLSDDEKVQEKPPQSKKMTKKEKRMKAKKQKIAVKSANNTKSPKNNSKDNKMKSKKNKK